MKNMETEFKWEANAPRAFAKMLAAARKNARVSTPEKLQITDVYLASQDGSFEKEQIAFRVRNYSGKWEATFKTRTEIKNGKAVRREETLPLVGVRTVSDALTFLNAKKRWKGLCVANLKPIFQIRNKRQIWCVAVKGAEGELSFDDCQIGVCGRQVLMKEIELEAKRGSTKKLEELAAVLTQQSGLNAARVSKVKTAAALLKLWGDQ